MNNHKKLIKDIVAAEEYGNIDFLGNFDTEPEDNTLIISKEGGATINEESFEIDFSEKIKSDISVQIIECDDNKYDSEEMVRYYELILKVTQDNLDTFFRVKGEYGSWSGTEWSDKVEEVAPEQKTITVYNKVKKPRKN